MLKTKIYSLLLLMFSIYLSFIALYASSAKASESTSANKSMQVLKSFSNPAKGVSNQIKFKFEPDLPDGKYLYIVELKETPAAMEREAVEELRRIRTASNNSTSRSYTRQQVTALNRQLDKISKQQSLFMQDANLKLQGAKSLAHYKYAINAVALELTQDEAKSLATLKHVSKITRDKMLKLHTDTGPRLIGAPRVWTGDASPGISQTQGEGVVIGIIDSGVNTDHPSFAERSGDGFLHTNPRGSGVFLGDCAQGFPQLCNNKLIGVYSYPIITNRYNNNDVTPPNIPANGEDYDGHGSHVASTAAGNVLRNVAEVFPAQDQLTSDGIPTGFTFDEISGVAPRANIISYQVCFPGEVNEDGGPAGCPSAATLLAIEDAIEDGIDVLNFSISGGGDPWSNATDRAFLSARNAGIFVAVSAGNSGPEASSTEKFAPWYTSVAASEHGRENVFLKELTNFTGGASTLADISGQSNTGSITAAIVYAGDFNNPNDPVGESEQCLEPFPAGTFSGQIVVCDRGEIARVQKAENVAAGGAGGYVLANVDNGEQSFLANDQYVVPGIHINAENGNRLKAWLASGSGHRATITAGEVTNIVNDDRVDVLAGFSSRGPNTFISTLTPTMSAPGVNIYAAYADEQIRYDGHTPAASDYSFLDGTSMSSPHVAGAAALVKAAHPTWGPDEIRSALSFTATSNMLKEDGQTAADFFDMGAGRIQVDKAIASGLIMSESASNYQSADPDLGGDARSLNIPSITDAACELGCTWSRTFTATTDATWTFASQSITNSLMISAEPTSFTLLENETQTVAFTITNRSPNAQEYAFGVAKFTSPGLPDVDLPVSALFYVGDLPDSVSLEGRRDVDSILVQDLTTIDIDNLFVGGYLPVKATSVAGQLAQDSVRSSYVDDFSDGVSVTEVNVPDGAIRLVAEIKETNASDLDLYVLLDSNGDGVFELDEEVARSQSFNSDEEIEISFPTSGNYSIIVHNFESSGIANFEMRYAVVENQFANDELRFVAPNTVNAAEPFDIRVIYDLPEAEVGDDYYSAITLGRFADDTSLGTIGLNIERARDDVFIEGETNRISENQTASFSVVVDSNPTDSAREYLLILPVPVGTEISDFTETNDGELVNNELRWRVNKAAGESSATRLEVEIAALQGVEAGPILIQTQSVIENQDFSELENSQIFTDIQIEGSPSISFNGQQMLSLSVTETQTTSFPITVSEPNNDPVTFTFNQISGPASAITQALDVFSFIAPEVTSDTVFEYEVVVSDPNGRSTSGNINITVLNNNAPVIDSVNVPASGTGGRNITLSITASDPENDPLTFTVNGNQIQGSSTSLRLPSNGSSVSYTVVASDGISQTSQTVSVSVTQPPPSSGGGGGSVAWYLLFLLPIIVCRYKKG